MDKPPHFIYLFFSQFWRILKVDPSVSGVKTAILVVIQKLAA